MILVVAFLGWLALALVGACAIIVSGRIGDREGDPPVGIGARTERGSGLRQ